jgi:hypothetical protein
MKLIKVVITLVAIMTLNLKAVSIVVSEHTQSNQIGIVSSGKSSSLEQRSIFVTSLDEPLNFSIVGSVLICDFSSTYLPTEAVSTLNLLKFFDHSKVIKKLKDWPKSSTSQFKVDFKITISTKEEHLHCVNTIPKDFFGNQKVGDTIVIGKWFITGLKLNLQNSTTSWSSIIASKKDSSIVYYVVNW